LLVLLLLLLQLNYHQQFGSYDDDDELMAHLNQLLLVMVKYLFDPHQAEQTTYEFM
jgi:hypothetical protein